jgi:hypothetical protein
MRGNLIERQHVPDSFIQKYINAKLDAAREGKRYKFDMTQVLSNWVCQELKKLLL